MFLATKSAAEFAPEQVYQECKARNLAFWALIRCWKRLVAWKQLNCSRMMEVSRCLHGRV
jgi:hypothetical protein